MIRNVFLLLALVCIQWTHSQDESGLDYFLPNGVSYDASIPKPVDVIGHEVGQWHVSHDKLAQYMYALAESSERISIENRGHTFEGRPILLLTITAPENHNRLEEIRQQHLALTEAGAAEISNQPVVIYQGFSIHGNEPSGANAGLAYAYHLAAAQGAEIETQLRNTVILMDPSFNPDGLQRFSQWANTHKSIHLNPDPNDREYWEIWPRGRTNHYWFDLNRDWLPVQLPESRARIKTFHNWLPNILTDHHEMGTNSTFFFQPGEPSRVHPLTPSKNQELTAEIGTYHTKALDKIGSLYYSEEDYDDYYYGKGSTFPDVNGSIGILFEQASSRGHIQESDNGLLRFPFTIRNQFTTALSTLEAAVGMRTKLLDFQKSYYANLRREASGSRVKSIVFGAPDDASRARHLAEILDRQRIRYRTLDQELTINGVTYSPNKAYVVPMNQKNPRLIRAMFEKRTTFTDSLFYDISAWTFPLAFNLDYAELNTIPSQSREATSLPGFSGSVSGTSNYAYLFQWHDYYSPKVLQKILEAGLRAKVAKDRFSLNGVSYDYGTVLVPVQNQKMNPVEISKLLQDAVKNTGVTITAVNTGATRGIDLGSRDFELVEKPEVALIVGDGVRSYDAGEIWHLFDTRYEMKITKLDARYLHRVDLSRYSDIIIPSASGGTFNEAAVKNLKEWVREGGTLIGYRQVAQWMDRNEFLNLKFKRDTLKAKNVSYAEKEEHFGAQVTGGAIFEARLDVSHPINYGYKRDKLPLFRNSNIYLEPEENSFDNPIQYTSDPLMSGYISEENAALIKNSSPFKVGRMGRGRVILFTDNTNFRAFWYGTNKLLMNAIFFGHFM